MVKASLALESVGKNLTDRGKTGTKCSVLTDEKGLPLAVVLSGANTHDVKLLEETLEHIVALRPKPDKNIRKICVWALAGYIGNSEKVQLRGYMPHYGSWSELSRRVSVLRILSSQIYLGTLKFGDVVVENAHEAIVDRGTFDRVASLRMKRREIYGDAPYQTKYLLASLLFCARCGARYAVKHNYGGYKYYTCYTRAVVVKSPS